MTETPHRTRLELRSVRVRPDGADHDVVVDASLCLGEGEVIGVLGSSGAGKSTLLRAIVGLDPVTDGGMLLDGVDVTAMPTHRRGIGLMFQDHALFPHLDVAGNVDFGMRMQRRSRTDRRERVSELLVLVGLGGMGERSVASLSGGERQRVALARALAPAPRVLLLDEPMGSLDRALREDLLDELARILELTSTPAMYVTHDHVEATTIADRLVVLDHGRIVQQGPTPEVIAAPVDAHVARLLGVGPGGEGSPTRVGG